MKEAPSFEGAFSFQRHPHQGTIPGWGTLRVWVLAAGAGRLRGEVRGRGCRAGWQVLPMDLRLFLRERGT